MAEAGQCRQQHPQSQGVNPTTGQRTLIEPSPADGVVPTANTSDPDVTTEKHAPKKLVRGNN